MATRDDFPRHVVDALCKRAAYICSNPDCRANTLAPSDADPGKALYIGKAAHICAAASGGPRYLAGMSAAERSAIDNGIFLCSTCADLIDKNGGADFPGHLLQHWRREHEQWVAQNLNKRSRTDGVGGDGGDGTIIGERGTVIAGRGGTGGISGRGGKGGSGFVQGNDALIIGGDGGNAGTADGRGGRRAQSPMRRSGLPTQFWGFGSGGSGANHPEYERRLGVLQVIRSEYMTAFPDDARFVMAGIEPVPLDWVNQRLIEGGESWQVTLGAEGYVLPALPLTQG